MSVPSVLLHSGKSSCYLSCSVYLCGHAINCSLCSAAPHHPCPALCACHSGWTEATDDAASPPSGQS